jgi:hypothetical protein
MKYRRLCYELRRSFGSAFLMLQLGSDCEYFNLHFCISEMPTIPRVILIEMFS